jgi:choline dehydrogenase-like flavoprotein
LLGARARLQLVRPTGLTKVAFVLAEERTRREELLAFSGHFQTVSAGRDSEAYQAMKLVVRNLRSPRRLFRQIRTRSLPVGTGRMVGRMLKGTPQVVRAVYQEALRQPRRLAIYTQAEQSPNPQSRVTLDPKRRDALGVPRLQVQWRLSSLDKRSIVRNQEILAEHFSRSGVGRLVPTEAFGDDGPDWGAGLAGGHHHLGTARMADDQRRGVVDRHQRVHTVPDLFVGDSSVFPTGGFANPMLTTVALALRLADHLRASYGPR